MNTNLNDLMIGMIGMFFLTLVIVLFVVVYQRKLLKQKKERESVEAEYQKALLEATVKSQENERERIAKDLHDGVGVMLSTAQLYMDQLVEDTPGLAEKEKTKVYELLEDSIQTVRQISGNLRPVILRNLGLAEAVNTLCQTVGNAGGLAIELKDDYEEKLDSQRELVIYRILQELLANTIRHAEASTVRVMLIGKSQHFCLVYEDDGKGFSSPYKNASGGLGIKNIESRVQILGGQMTLEQPAKGMKMVIEIIRES